MNDPIVTPGTTPIRMLARAVADALTLPGPHAFHDEQLRCNVLNQRAIVVTVVCQRLAGDPDADLLDAAAAATSITDRCGDYPVNYTTGPADGLS